jgi:hypothetical protein
MIRLTLLHSSGLAVWVNPSVISAIGPGSDLTSLVYVPGHTLYVEENQEQIIELMISHDEGMRPDQWNDIYDRVWRVRNGLPALPSGPSGSV